MKVLLIDDEENIVTIMRLTLADAGHDVLTASNGQEGRSLYMQHLASGAPFEVVVTDFRMPIKDGGEVIREIFAVRPDQKIIVVSAYSYEITDSAHTIPRDKVRIIHKPFDPDDLVRLVQSI